MIYEEQTPESTLNELLSFLERQPGSRPKAIAEALGVSRQYVQKLLAKHNELFSVTGSGPNRFYRLKVQSNIIEKTADYAVVPEGERQANMLIDRNFYSLTPLGEELIGLAGFEQWCKARKFNLQAKKQEYIEILDKYYPKQIKRPIDFTNKLAVAFNDIALQRVWAVDYYNFEIFGKTKLGTQVMIAKQTGDVKTMQGLISNTNLAVEALRKKEKFQAIAFVSPTIQRQAQLMSKLESHVAIDLPRIKIHKVGARILVAQKTLKILQDRILNAEQTFVVESPESYEKVLIVDDALGSGATLNEIAKQILQKKIAKKCYGLVLVASPSGYEVINDV